MAGGASRYLSLIKAAVPRRFQTEVLALLNNYVLRSELDQAVVEVPVSHTLLTDIGTTDHLNIDAHIADVTNPHSVTHAQTGVTTDQHHNKSHTHDGADGSGTVSHTDLDDIGTNTHAQIDTHIGDATIHFTQAEIVWEVLSKSANYTATTSNVTIECDASGADFTVILPAAASHTGRSIIVTSISTGIVTIDGAGAETISGETSWDIIWEWESIIMVSNGTSWTIR